MKKIILPLVAVLLLIGLWMIIPSKDSSVDDVNFEPVPTAEEQTAINGFELEKPDGWHEQSGAMIGENFSKFEFSDAELEDMLTSHQGSVPIAIYTKYKPEEVAGMIPTIQVNLRPNQTRDFDEFREVMEQSAEGMENFFSDFEYIDELQETEIAGIKSFYFKAEFDMQPVGGDEIHVRSWTYSIPVGSYFYQINLSDAFEEDDCSEIYRDVMDSITITKD